MNTTNKNELRQKYRALRDSFGEDFIKQASALACQNLINSREFLTAETILLYYPTKNEISPLPIFEICLKMGKTIAFPICQKESTTLLFRKTSALNELFLSSFGILEPTSDSEQITPNEKTLCVVPALLFSQNGHRLGYGKGYYDRFLKNFNGTSAGLSYSSLVLDSIPHDEHDVPLDMIVTEREVLKIAQKN